MPQYGTVANAINTFLQKDFKAFQEVINDRQRRG
jgi:hypothetical protein